MQTFVAVDVETTGLDFNTECIIELAASRFENGEITAEFQAFVPPAKALTAMSSLLTGLREEELRSAPPVAETLRAFLEFAGENPLVAHNAEFDATFIRRALEREGLPPVSGPWLDSLLLARTAWPAWDTHRLDYLAERLDILREEEHRALPDARRAGKVFLAAQETLRASTSSETWKILADLAEDLPGWKQVFHGENIPEGNARGSGPSPEDSALALPEDIDSEAGSVFDASKAMLEKRWLAWETTPQQDEIRTGLQVAMQAASLGSRVLFCVPDVAAWNAARKLRLAALAEPQGYLCRRRLNEWVNNPLQRLPVEERSFALPLVAWSAQTLSSRIADCRGFSPERARLFWSRVCCDAYAEDPGAQAALVEAAAADIILVTHAALCAHLQVDGALLPACDRAIFTSAHRLPEIARKVFGREVTFFRLRNILQLLRPSSGQDSAAWFEAERQLQRFFQKAGKQAAKKRLTGENRLRYTESVALAFGANPEPVLAALRENEIFLQDRSEERLASKLRSFRLDFETLCEARNPEEVYWLEDFTNPHKAALRSAPVVLDTVLGSPLRALFEGGLFLSPAIVVGEGEGRFFLRELGMESVEANGEVLLRSVPDIHPLRFWLAPFVPAVASMDSAVEFARFLFEAVTPFSEKGVVVFFPSPGTLRAVYPSLRALLPPGAPLWAQHIDGGKDALIKLFASAKGGIVLVAEGMEGLRDGEGQSPGLVVVTRMPLPSSREPWVEAQGEHLRARGGYLRYEVLHPAAALRLKRELAPLRRVEGLKVIWLLDARASGEGLGAYAAHALDCQPQTAADLKFLQAATRAVLFS